MAVVRRGGAARAWRRCRRAQRMRSPARPRRTAAAGTGGAGWARRSGGSCGARCGCGGGQADACQGRELCVKIILMFNRLIPYNLNDAATCSCIT